MNSQAIPAQLLDLFETVACNLCGSSDYVRLNIGLISERQTQDIGIQRSQWVLCRRCSLVYQNPRPGGWFWKKYYEESYYRDMQSGKEIEPGYVEYSYRQFEKLRNWVSSHGVVIGQEFPHSYLDYGCGIGGTLKYFRDNGCNSVQGIEVDPLLRDAARSIFNVDLVQDENHPEILGKQFDLVFTHHCLEHMRDMNEFFAFLKSHLADSGVAVIVLPTYRHGRTQFDYGTSITHNFVVTEYTLGKFLEKHGLSVIATRYARVFWEADNEIWCLARQVGVPPNPLHFDKEVSVQAWRELQLWVPLRILVFWLPDKIIRRFWRPIWRAVRWAAMTLLPVSVIAALRQRKGA